MAWKAWTANRTVDIQGSGPGEHYADYLITFIGAVGTENAATALPVLGQTYNQVCGGAALGTTLGSGATAITLDSEPKVIQSSTVHKLDVARCRVRVRFRSYIVEAV